MELLRAKDYEAFVDHISRHLAENGDPDVFMLPQSLDLVLSSIDPSLWDLSTTQPGWQRVWVARDKIGHVRAHCILSSNSLAPHRATIACGVETLFRRQGLARSLMTLAIEYGRWSALLDWIDGNAVVTNAPVLALDYSLGFHVVGTIADSFRVEGKSYDQHLLALKLTCP